MPQTRSCAKAAISLNAAASKDTSKLKNKPASGRPGRQRLGEGLATAKELAAHIRNLAKSARLAIVNKKRYTPPKHIEKATAQRKPPAGLKRKREEDDQAGSEAATLPAVLAHSANEASDARPRKRRAASKLDRKQGGKTITNLSPVPENPSLPDDDSPTSLSSHASEDDPSSDPPTNFSDYRNPMVATSSLEQSYTVQIRRSQDTDSPQQPSKGSGSYANMTEDQITARRKARKQWRDSNKVKCRLYNRRYRAKKARERAAVKEAR